MSDETFRYYNPVTLLTERATPAYAAVNGLCFWDGPSDECEYDKNNVERAKLVVETLAEISRPELQTRAQDLGLSTKGTKAELEARIAAHVESLEVQNETAEVAGTDWSPVEVDPTELDGEPAVGETNETTSPKEG